MECCVLSNSRIVGDNVRLSIPIVFPAMALCFELYVLQVDILRSSASVSSSPLDSLAMTFKGF